MVDVETVIILGGMLVVSYIIMVQVARGIIKTTGKTAQIAGLLKQLGIKNFKPGDLNSDKLDDTGFGRLIALIREVQGGGPASGLQGQIAQLQALGQLGQLSNPLGAALRQPPAPQG